MWDTKVGDMGDTLMPCYNLELKNVNLYNQALLVSQSRSYLVSLMQEENANIVLGKHNQTTCYSHTFFLWVKNNK